MYSIPAVYMACNWETCIVRAHSPGCLRVAIVWLYMPSSVRCVCESAQKLIYDTIGTSADAVPHRLTKKKQNKNPLSAHTHTVIVPYPMAQHEMDKNWITHTYLCWRIIRWVMAWCFQHNSRGPLSVEWTHLRKNPISSVWSFWSVAHILLSSFFFFLLRRCARDLVFVYLAISTRGGYLVLFVYFHVCMCVHISGTTMALACGMSIYCDVLKNCNVEMLLLSASAHLYVNSTQTIKEKKHTQQARIYSPFAIFFF